MEKTTKIPLFRRCVIQNFPFIEEDFDALTDYGLLCKVVEYLNKVIEQTNINSGQVEELSDAFNSLKSYVEHYFDNLDVQEEINNKLDDMAESGQLADIISQYLNSTAIFGYDSVADMKSSENLVNGSYARTLGYYSKNDGGAALYKIRTVTNDDVIDEAFIIEIGDSSNQLVAELINENGKIFVNQLGADNTGTNDASDKINLGLTKINSLWLEGSKTNTLVFNGKYRLDNQIEVPPCAKLRSDGFVKFISNVQGESTIFIHYLTNDLPDTDINKQQYLNGDIINFESGCLLESTGDFHDSSATGLEIGDRTNKGSQYAISRYAIRNICIMNFNVGIQFNAYNVYIGNHENLHLEQNMINIRFGLESQNASASNSGERMTFNNCVIAAADKGIEFQTKYWGVFFNNCSFDYVNKCFFNQNNNTREEKIHIEGSHFEAFVSLFEGFAANTRPQFYITNSEILNSLGSTTLLKDCDVSYPLILTDCNLQHKYSVTDNNPEHYVNVNQNIILKENLYMPANTRNYSLFNNLLGKFVDGIDDGSISLGVGSYLGDFKITERWNCGNSALVSTDNYLYNGHKSLTLTKNSASGGNPILLNAETDKRPINGAKMMYATIISDGNIQLDQRCFIRYYDINNNRITTIENTHYYDPVPTAGSWALNPIGFASIVPPNAVYYDAFLNIKGATADGVGATLKIGGVIVNAR